MLKSSTLQEKPIVQYHGIYKKTASTAEAVFMITGMTIGAGILGLPYVAAQSGLLVGVILLLGLGAVMLGLNLMIGEIAVRTRTKLQLPGLAGKYLGEWAKFVLSATLIISSFGILLAYIIGEGEAMAALFGGNRAFWSVLFWSIGSFLIWQGIGAIKKTEKILSSLVILTLAGLSFYLLKDLRMENAVQFSLSKFFLPYGVILFALRATPAIVEAHALMPDSQRQFRRAVTIGTLIPIAVYLLFIIAVVGAQGKGVTEIATIGLGRQFGAAVMAVGNLFAMLAMGTAFLSLGEALKHALAWDLKLDRMAAAFLVALAPLFLFVAGLRSFVAIIDVVGGFFISFEAICMVLIAWQAKRKGDLNASRYGLHHFWLLAVPVGLAFTFATVYYIVRILY